MWRQSQIRGHNVADLDPLGMFAADLDPSEVPELLLRTHSLGKAQHLLGLPRLSPCNACNCFAVVKSLLTHTKEDNGCNSLGCVCVCMVCCLTHPCCTLFSYTG